MIKKDDKYYIRKCIELAKKSFDKGEAPFGSIVVKKGKIIASCTNANVKKGDVTSHAEIMAMRLAQKKLKSKDLKDCEIYSNCEPCPMCSFMMRELHFNKVVFGVRSPNMGGYSRWKILKDKKLENFRPFFLKPPIVKAGVLEKEAMAFYEKIGWSGFVKKI